MISVPSRRFQKKQHIDLKQSTDTVPVLTATKMYMKNPEEAANPAHFECRTPSFAPETALVGQSCYVGPNLVICLLFIFV